VSPAPVEFAQMRCFRHPQREAAAKCPECKRFFCRECVTEHDDRIICASCLRKLASAEKPKTARLRTVVLGAQALVGFLIAWICFYYVGQTALSIPSSLHEGSVWKKLEEEFQFRNE